MSASASETGKTATKSAGNGMIHGMKQGLKTAASIALATTCAAAPLHSEAGERPNDVPAIVQPTQPSFDVKAPRIGDVYEVEGRDRGGGMG